MTIRGIGLLSLWMVAGCATVVHGSHQTIGISSNPAGAGVYINGEFKGETPLKVELPRKQDHMIKVVKEGYDPASATLTSKASGWFLGNLLLGGPIGMLVDAGGGGAYELSQDDVQLNLTKLETAGVAPADVILRSPSPETSEAPSTAQENLKQALTTEQVTPTPGNWLLGQWVGTQDGRWSPEDVTIRITSYDQSTHAFRGDGVKHNLEGSAIGATTDLLIEALLDDEGRVVMTIHYAVGRSSTFNLKRKGENTLSGATAYGLPRLTLDKVH